MPQPKRQSARSSRSGARKPAAKRSTARKPASAAKRSSAARKTSAARKSAAARKPAARKPARSRRRRAISDEALRANVQAALEALTRGVVLTTERLQEVMDDAVGRGRMTRTDANELVADLLNRGRKQTEDVLADLEQLLGRSRSQLETAAGDARKRATDARRRASRMPQADRALREVDRARRAAGLGSFPVLGYDELTAGQVSDRVADLTAAELRKVRDYERRNANRKSVLTAIEKALG